MLLNIWKTLNNPNTPNQQQKRRTHFTFMFNYFYLVAGDHPGSELPATQRNIYLWVDVIHREKKQQLNANNEQDCVEYRKT